MNKDMLFITITESNGNIRVIEDIGRKIYNVGDILFIDGKRYICTKSLTGLCRYYFCESSKDLNGEEILSMIRNNKFKENDRIIAKSYDSLDYELISVFEFRRNSKGNYSFEDVEYDDSSLDALDLIECRFEIVDMKEFRREELKKLQEKRKEIYNELKKVDLEISKFIKLDDEK